MTRQMGKLNTGFRRHLREYGRPLCALGVSTESAMVRFGKSI